MKKYLFLISILLGFPFCKDLAQTGFRNGYIITVNNDTVYGEIAGKSNIHNNICYFRTSDGIVEYNPLQITGFGYSDGKHYTSLIIEGAFIEVLVSGEICLYRTAIDFYIQKRGGEILKLESKETSYQMRAKKVIKKDTRWKGLVSIMVFDCLKDMQVIQNLTLSEGSLTKLAINYNKCKGSAYIDYKEGKPWMKLDLGLSAGATHSSIELVDFDQQYGFLNFEAKSVDPSFGLSMALYSPRLTEKFAFQTELQIVKTGYFDTERIERLTYSEYHDTYVNFTTLSFPLSIRYSLENPKLPLFFNAGVAYARVLNSDSKRISDVKVNNIITTSDDRAFEFNKNQIGYWGSIGYLRPFGKFNAGTTLRYTYTKKLHRFDNWHTSLHQISLSLIIML